MKKVIIAVLALSSSVTFANGAIGSGGPPLGHGITCWGNTTNPLTYLTLTDLLGNGHIQADAQGPFGFLNGLAVNRADDNLVQITTFSGIGFSLKIEEGTVGPDKCVGHFEYQQFKTDMDCTCK